MEKTEKPFDDKLIIIAEKIKTLRKEKGFTSHETFAFEHELNRVQYWRVEAGKNITLRTLLRILEIHDLTLDEFFRGL
ncbi:helix-turn-helix domain-containing protein [Flavobacterium suzhouense]|uniref:Helix-turn-helix domain-containing protein n=1 Tax=Flavobacterium suzhouense TaxID=1529638 RepID=A0ABW5NSF1_9FLAO